MAEIDGIKSALEIAMEKLEGLGEATDEERLRWKYVPEGEKLAARYLREDLNLVTGLGRYDESAAGYIKEGAAEILIRNIDLPRDDLARKNNRRAMEGLKALKKDKAGVENIYSKIRHLSSHYVEQGEQQRKQAYQTLKTEFEAKLRQALQQQMGSVVGAKVDAERQPQFHEEWRRVLAQLDSQYLKLLDECRQELLAIP